MFVCVCVWVCVCMLFCPCTHRRTLRQITPTHSRAAHVPYTADTLQPPHITDNNTTHSHVYHVHRTRIANATNTHTHPADAATHRHTQYTQPNNTHNTYNTHNAQRTQHTQHTLRKVFGVPLEALVRLEAQRVQHRGGGKDTTQPRTYIVLLLCVVFV